MVDQLLPVFAAIVVALFVTELTDKDALLLLTLAAKGRGVVVFMAGSVAFVLTTGLFVSAGALVNSVVPIVWVKLAGGAFMVVYGLWQAKGLVGQGLVEREEREMEGKTYSLSVFLVMVATLALLDVAGDATEVLTILLVAQYKDAALVFSAACSGLIIATGVETLLGNRLGRLLTLKRMKYVSTAVPFILGTSILLSSVY